MEAVIEVVDSFEDEDAGAAIRGMVRSLDPMSTYNGHTVHRPELVGALVRACIEPRDEPLERRRFVVLPEDRRETHRRHRVTPPAEDDLDGLDEEETDCDGDLDLVDPALYPRTPSSPPPRPGVDDDEVMNER